ncbi:MAG: hypothetical protein J0L93_02105 [Deltaproteobacteria bacterium]|nr:hypothetical protein [Deltaproteobacteria bacterium]
MKPIKFILLGVCLVLISSSIFSEPNIQKNEATSSCDKTLRLVTAFMLPVAGLPVAAGLAKKGRMQDARHFFLASTLGIAAAINFNYNFVASTMDSNRNSFAWQLWQQSQPKGPVLMIIGPGPSASMTEKSFRAELQRKNPKDAVDITKIYIHASGDLENRARDFGDKKFKTVVLIGHHLVGDPNFIRLEDNNGEQNSGLSERNFKSLLPYLDKDLEIICHSCQSLSSKVEEKNWNNFAKLHRSINAGGQIYVTAPTKVLRHHDQAQLPFQQSFTHLPLDAFVLNPLLSLTLPIIQKANDRVFETWPQYQKYPDAWNSNGPPIRRIRFPVEESFTSH